MPATEVKISSGNLDEAGEVFRLYRSFYLAVPLRSDEEVDPPLALLSRMIETALPLRSDRAARGARTGCATAVALLLALLGCQAREKPAENLFHIPAPDAGANPAAASASVPAPVSMITPVSFAAPTHHPPPRIRDFNSLETWPMTLDEAVQTALRNGTVIRDANGMVLTMPERVRTNWDNEAAITDPNFGPAAALSAYDMQLESGLVWNGGGNPISSAFSSGTFGAFSQPETMAKLGLGKRTIRGAQVSFGGVGGYDSTLASGVYAAYGAALRQPLLRGAGKDINQIAGPLARPGYYGGICIAQIESNRVELDLERAVRDLVWQVSRAYWELGFAYQNVSAKRAALDHARQSWEREKSRVAEQAGPADFEARARQQYYSAEVAYQNAISGTATDPSGVYNVETKLRSLLSLPMDDGRLIRPTEMPLTAEFVCDWGEATVLAHTRRIELRKQQAAIERRRLELKAAKNMLLPQVDFVGQIRRLADDGSTDAATFGQALQGWQIGVESQQMIGKRRERAAVRNAELLISREQALYEEQQRAVEAELRSAFTELDRAYGVMKMLDAGREGARICLDAETKRHAAGDAHIERVLEAQTRAMLAETAFQRAVVDYNLAFLQLHFARGTLLDVLNVGLMQDIASPDPTNLQQLPSLFSAPQEFIDAPAASPAVPAPTPSTQAPLIPQQSSPLPTPNFDRNNLL